VNRHDGVKETYGIKTCRPCHGGNDHGTVLSVAQADRTLDLGSKGTQKIYRGQMIGCYMCHDGPNNEDGPSNRPPTANDNSASVVDTPVDIALSASDPDGDTLTLRIVEQAKYGRVALSGSTATYIPDPGFAGVDTFTFVARDGRIDSNIATVSVTRGATWANYGIGYPGTGGAIPSLTLDKNPQLGAHITLTFGNTSGKSELAMIVLSTEQASLTTTWGGVIVTEMSYLLMTTEPAAGVSFSADVPNDPALIGESEYIQSLQLDPGAQFGVAFSYGLRMTIGQ
jgi:hypothetical protein